MLMYSWRALGGTAQTISSGCRPCRPSSRSPHSVTHREVPLWVGVLCHAQRCPSVAVALRFVQSVHLRLNIANKLVQLVRVSSLGDLEARRAQQRCWTWSGIHVLRPSCTVLLERIWSRLFDLWWAPLMEAGGLRKSSTLSG